MDVVENKMMKIGKIWKIIWKRRCMKYERYEKTYGKDVIISKFHVFHYLTCFR